MHTKEIQKLREETGAGYLDCRNALQQTAGNLAQAIALLKERGLAQAQKKVDRATPQGNIFIAVNSKSVLMVELNCETDFVAKSDPFMQFGNELTTWLLDQPSITIDLLLSLPWKEGKSVDQLRQQLIAQIGENIQIKRSARLDHEDSSTGATQQFAVEVEFQNRSNTAHRYLGSYSHGGKIGVLVECQGGTAPLAKTISMQLAAMAPSADTPFEEQPFIQNPQQKMGQFLAEHQIQLMRFVRFERGKDE